MLIIVIISSSRSIQTHPLIGRGENKPRQNHPKGTTIPRKYFTGYQRKKSSKLKLTHPESNLISNFSFRTQRRKWQRPFSQLGKPSLSCWKCGMSFILRLRTLDRICVPMAVQWYVTYMHRRQNECDVRFVCGC